MKPSARQVLLATVMICAAILTNTLPAAGAGPVSVIVSDPRTGEVIRMRGTLQSGGTDRLSRFVEAAGLIDLHLGSGDGLLPSPPAMPPAQRVAAVTLTLTGSTTEAYWIYAADRDPLVQVIREYGTRNTWFQADGVLLEVLAEMGIDPFPEEMGIDPFPEESTSWPRWLATALGGAAVGLLIGVWRTHLGPRSRRDPAA